jgi:hypothetical protein
LRLSESRAKLAWAMPSVSKLNKVKQVHDDYLLWVFVICYEVQMKQKGEYVPCNCEYVIHSL